MSITNTGKTYFDAREIHEMRPQHKNIAVAMVAACICHYWDRGVEPEAVLLNWHLYNLYKDFVRVVYGEEIADAEDFWWHGIQIRREKFLSGRRIWVEIKKK